jgi:hypothetical protein
VASKKAAAKINGNVNQIATKTNNLTHILRENQSSGSPAQRH